MTSENNTIISAGPSKFDLMVSLFEGIQGRRKTIVFRVDSGKREKRGFRNSNRTVYSEVEVKISLIAREDISGESWLFEGSMVGMARGNIHGYYSTQTRKGWYARGARYTVSGICSKS